LTLFKPLRSLEDSICELAANRFIVVEEKTDGDRTYTSLSATQLGRAALVSALPPDAALFVFADLQQATKAIALDTELHMLYLVTPTNCSIWQGCDWNHMHSVFSKLSPGERRVAKLVSHARYRYTLGLTFQHLTEAIRFPYAFHAFRYSRPFHPLTFQLHLRFFSALALFDVINEKSVDEVARRFRISRGTLQTLQQQSATYAAMVVAFCSRLGWIYLCELLKGFATRLAFGVRRELTELVSVAGIDATRARVFHEHDVTSMVELSNCTVKRIKEILSLAVPFSR
uniref:Nuclease HARBI1 n=1 Tax=Heligmosomoides polygyrus TaxID=6339 RepID=A0A183FGQ8_HELPZ